MKKDSARYAVKHLLEKFGNRFEVCLVAADMLRFDGLYQRALRQLDLALNLNPADAHVIYLNRSRPLSLPLETTSAHEKS